MGSVAAQQMPVAGRRARGSGGAAGHASRSCVSTSIAMPRVTEMAGTLIARPPNGTYICGARANRCLPVCDDCAQYNATDQSVSGRCSHAPSLHCCSCCARQKSYLATSDVERAESNARRARPPRVAMLICTRQVRNVRFRIRAAYAWRVLCIFVLVTAVVRAPAPTCPREHATAKAQRAAGERIIDALQRRELAEGSAATAVACFRAALASIGSQDPQSRGEVGVLLADALEMAGDVEGSAAQLRQVAGEFPLSPVPPFKLGNQARVAERWQDAVDNYEKAVRLAPTFVNARTNLGMSLRGLNRLDDAIEAYRGALKVAPARADIHVNLGVALDAAGHMEASRDAYEEGVRLDPLLYQGYFNLGVLLAESFKDRDAGIRLYHESLRIAPTFADAYHTLGTVHTNIGKYQEARGYLEQAVSLRPDDRCRFLRPPVFCCVPTCDRN